MFRKTLSTLSLVALATAVSLWAGTPVSAAPRGGHGGGGGHAGGHGGGGFHGGGHGGSGFHGGGHGGGGFHAGGFHAGGFHTGGFNRGSARGGLYGGIYGGLYPGVGYGWGGYPGYYASSPYSYGYAPSYYSSTPYSYGYAPTYYYAPNAYTVVPPVVSTSAYPPSTTETRVFFDLTVPENAEVWFDNTKTTPTGRVREYTTSNLTPGQVYSYNIHVRWPDANGQIVEKEHKVTFHPGDHLSFDFTQNGS
jgi:uncharacterized protein (TIGR03000 family)